MRHTKENSGSACFRVTEFMGLLAIGFLVWTGIANAAAFRVGVDYRMIEVEFAPTYYQDSYPRSGHTEESAKLFGVRGELETNWALSERSSIGIAPALTFFLGGSWEAIGGDANNPLSGDPNLGAEFSIPFVFSYSANEKVRFSGDLGVSYAYISLGEPGDGNFQFSSDRRYYEDGVDWELVDLYFAPAVHYRMNDKTGIGFRWRMTLTGIGGGASYADEPEPEVLWSYGPQFLFEFGF